jgi:hypothetical protein
MAILLDLGLPKHPLNPLEGERKRGCTSVVCDPQNTVPVYCTYNLREQGTGMVRVPQTIEGGGWFVGHKPLRDGLLIYAT